MFPNHTEFEFHTSSDGVSAKPADSAAEPVELPAKWADTATTDGGWTQAVDAVVRAAVTGSTVPPSVGETGLVIDQTAVVDALTAAEAVDADAVPAAAAYLAHSGVFPAEDGAVTVAPADPETTVGVYPWAVLCDAIASNVAERAERLRDAGKRVQGRFGPDPDHIANLEQERADRKAQLVELAGDVDEDVEEELTAAELERFERLRTEYFHYDSLLESNMMSESPRSMAPVEEIVRTATALDATADRLSERATTYRRAASGQLTVGSPGIEGVDSAETAVELLRERDQQSTESFMESADRLVDAGHALAVAGT